jgi:hypothetical protein
MSQEYQDNHHQDERPLTMSDTFTIQEYQPYYHPRHPEFFVQSLGGVVFFTHIPGGTRVNESVRLQSIADGRWSTFTSSVLGGATIPVALWRQGPTLRGRWL